MDEENENKLQEANNKVTDAKNDIKNISKGAAKGAAGNYVGAAKDFLKSKAFRKAIRLALLKIVAVILLIVLAVYIVAQPLFTIYDTVKNLTLTNMGQTLPNADSTTQSSISKIFSRVGKLIKSLFGVNDESEKYWINLEEKSKFIIDKDTGENLAYVDEEANQKLMLSRTALVKMLKESDPDKKVEDVTQNELAKYTEEFLSSGLVNPSEEEKEYTMVDNYIKELGNQGISLKELRMLGEADYEDINQILDDDKTRKLVEKYIAEFLRADIITQQPHRTSGNALISENNQNLVDGGIFLWRNTLEQILSDELLDQLKGSPPPTILQDSAFKPLTYIPPEEFLFIAGYASSEDEAKSKLREKKFRTIIEEQDGEDGHPLESGTIDKLFYKFTQDPDTDEIVIIKFRTEEEADGTFENPLENIAATQKNGRVTRYMDIEFLDYKEKIAKYIMPYEFLINLCQITQNPEFVYHVALLARKTYIVLRIQDEYAVKRDTIDQKIEERVTVEYTNPDTGEVTTSEETVTTKTRNVKTKREYTPTLQLRLAETWSWFEDFDYLKYILMRR